MVASRMLERTPWSTDRLEERIEDGAENSLALKRKTCGNVTMRDGILDVSFRDWCVRILLDS